MPLVYVNGELVEEKDAVVSVFDHGLVVGDGVFETVEVWRGRPFALRRHLERLARSAAGLGIGCPSAEAVAEAVAAVVASTGEEQGRIRITVTAGLGPLGSPRDDGPPSLIVAFGALGEVAEHCRVVVVPWPRNERGALAGLKTTSYAENALAVAYAHERDAGEAIFANTVGELCEGTGSNVFVVKEGELLTPPLSSGCLAGVTRALLIEHHGAIERPIPIEEFRPGRIEEAFITSTLRGVLPISAIDGDELSPAGPLTKRAAASFAALLEETSEP